MEGRYSIIYHLLVALILVSTFLNNTTLLHTLLMRYELGGYNNITDDYRMVIHLFMQLYLIARRKLSVYSGSIMLMCMLRTRY